MVQEKRNLTSQGMKDISQEIRTPVVSQWVKDMKQIQDDAEAALKFACNAMKAQYDKHRRDSPGFQTGDHDVGAAHGHWLLETIGLGRGSTRQRSDDV